MRSVDLTGEICPMTFVKFKLHLDRIQTGDCIEIVLKEGEHMKNMPQHIKDVGHLIETVRQEGEKYFLLVRKMH